MHRRRETINKGELYILYSQTVSARAMSREMTYLRWGKQDKEMCFNHCSRPGDGFRRIVYLVIRHNTCSLAVSRRKENVVIDM